jgi:exodeoxyribonuclease VII large subunit
MKVLAIGTVSVYPPQGKYQLDCISIVPLGTGDLYMAFEELKLKLGREGLFDISRKKPIPVFAKNIGIITSPTGAAVQDILTTLKRRSPLSEILLRPTLVQGDSAIEDIKNAIIELQSHNCDIIILARGGGSIEDLWAFNSEVVARTIANCSIPIIAGIGHETDFTIADFVADHRAATPTAAAELATSITISDFIHFIDNTENSIKKVISQTISQKKELVLRYEQHSGFKFVKDSIRYAIQKTDDLETRLFQNSQRTLAEHKKGFFALEQYFNALYPLQPLKKGFALLQKDGKTITSHEQLCTHDIITIQREFSTSTAQILSNSLE